MNLSLIVSPGKLMIKPSHMGGHFLKRCACGKVLAQCRCPGPKTETLVSPCRCKDKKHAS